MTESPTVKAARHNIASRLADVLWNAGVHDSGDVMALTDVVWTLAIQTAAAMERANAAAEGRTVTWRPTAGYSPSATTLQSVAHLIDYRARLAAETTTTEVDVFAGLPGVDD
jgi:hypothetical protein